MFSYVTGKIAFITEGAITIDIFGLGMQFSVPNESIFKVKEPVQLYAYMHWNSESGPSLFGFSSELEKKIFLLLISCSGIGPKMALAVLAHLPPALLIKVIQENDEKALSGVSGIGAKKAEQIIVQLRHKLPKLLESGIVVDDSQLASIHEWKNITQVLESLHYSKTEIDMALGHLKKQSSKGDNFDLLVRKALSFLAKRV